MPDNTTVNILIDVLAKTDQLQRAYNLFHEMVDRCSIPDFYTYTIVIWSLGQKGKVDEAVELVNEMAAKGYQPEIVTYSILIDAYGKAEDWDEAMQLFERAKGMADAVIYNSIMDGAIKKGDVHASSNLFEQMEAKTCILKFKQKKKSTTF
ncbi:hypothetical protein R1sor_010181 [Riccia sorocarpa]|uniref:Pentatricopeptide repeat-containing protein n=1 Tax=Riccia sorocarpa TaxID=122646 RepID=A0ABD3HX91_9MARC